MNGGIFQPELRIISGIQTGIRCKVCNGLHQGAKILPCQHSMCRRCLELSVDNTSVVCPSCQVSNSIPASGLDGYEDDVIISMEFNQGDVFREVRTGRFREHEHRLSRDQACLEALKSSEAPLPKLENFEGRHNVSDVVKFESTELKSPLAIAVDLNDDMYIAEFGSNRVTIFNMNAQVKGRIQGQGPTEFTPTGVALNSRRQVLITDIINFRVLIFGRTGYFIGEFGGKGCGSGQFLYPRGVACHRGLVYVCDSKRVQVFKENGEHIRTFGHDVLSKPTGVAFHNKVLVVADSENGMFVFNYKGCLLCAVDDKGVEPGQLRSPFGVTFDPEGFILVANGFNHRVDVFRRNGAFLTTFDRQFFIVRAVAFLKNRRLVVVHGNGFQIFTTDSFEPNIRRRTKCIIL